MPRKLGYFMAREGRSETSPFGISRLPVLAAWNLFSDVSASFPQGKSTFRRIDKKFPKIYEKMFWGNNLPSVAPKGKSYEPIWSTTELKAIARLMSCGLDLFAKSTKDWPNTKAAK